MKIKRKSKKNIIFVFFDVIYCGLVYQAGYMDYYLFGMYNMTKKERQTIVTRGVNNQFIKYFNNRNYFKVF